MIIEVTEVCVHTVNGLCICFCDEYVYMVSLMMIF